MLKYASNRGVNVDCLNWRTNVVLAVLMLTCLFTAGHEMQNANSQYSVGVLQPFWNITRGGPGADEGWSVAVDDVGYVYFAGFDRVSEATADIFLRKLSPDGTELWNSSWGGLFDDEAFVVTTLGEYVYVGGRTVKSFSDFD